MQAIHRTTLINWAQESVESLGFGRRTMMLTVKLIDMYLSKKNVKSIEKMRLLSITCLFTAAKYEEVTQSAAQDYSDISKGIFTRNDVLHTETKILTVIEFDLQHVYPTDFIEMYCHKSNAF